MGSSTICISRGCYHVSVSSQMRKSSPLFPNSRMDFRGNFCSVKLFRFYSLGTIRWQIEAPASQQHRVGPSAGRTHPSRRQRARCFPLSPENPHFQNSLKPPISLAPFAPQPQNRIPRNDNKTFERSRCFLVCPTPPTIPRGSRGN